MPTRVCTVSFVDVRGIRHSAEVEAESLYEAAVLGIRRLTHDQWSGKIGNGTVFDVEVRDPSTRHAISLAQIERGLAGATSNPTEATRKARLKNLLVQR
jgi:hypothetical protein